MIKKALILSLSLLFIACMMLLNVSVAQYSELDRAINKWSRQYDLDPLIVKSIIYVESVGGRYLERDDSYRLHRQQWALDAVQLYKCDVRDKRIWYSIGHMQVLYLNALHNSYTGSPEGLFDINTNLKYGCMYLADKQQFYAISDKGKWHAVASYNAGKARTVNGKYVNHEYVEKVRACYYRLGGRD